MEEKNFPVETIATGFTGRRQPVRGGGGGHPHTFTPTSAVAEGLGVCLRPVQRCGVNLVAEIPFAFPSIPVQ